MRSRTSFFNRTVFWNDLRRWWPLTAGYALLWLLILPLTRLTEYGRSYGVPSAWNMKLDTLGIAAVGGYWSAFCAGILFAMAAFSYLTSPRATNGAHALSARRETLFVSHWLAGLCAQLAVQVVVVLLTALVLASRGAFDPRVTGLMLLGLALPTVFFYSFGVLCMVFTGQILAAPVFYGVLNVLVVGVELLVKTFAGNFLYGWAEPQAASLTPLSPIVQLVSVNVRAVGTGNEYYDTGTVSGVRMTGEPVIQGLGWLWAYAAVGVVLAALALLVYRRRHSEATGSIVAIGWARPIFQYGVAFCAALALGQLIYYIFFGQYRANGSFSLAGSLACMAFAGLIGFFAAEMLLKKSFRVWRSGWKGALAVTAALVALGVVLSLDLTGYESYVPDVDAVESVQIDCNVYHTNASVYYTATDADAIRLVTAVHRAVIADKARQQGVERYGENDALTSGSFFTVNYRLKNGDTFRRRYSPVTLYRDEENAPGTPTAALSALYNDPDVALMRTLGRWGAKEDPRTLTDLRFTGGYCGISRWKDSYYQGETQNDLSPTEAKQLYDAVLRDAAAGHAFGSLFEAREDSLTVELYATYLDTRDYSGSTEPVWGEDGRAQAVYDLVITPRMTETLAALRAIGVDADFG